MQFLSYACKVPCCRLKSVEPDWKSAWTEVENGPCIIFKTVENYKTVIPQKVVAVAYTPGVRLTQVFVKRELTVYRDKKILGFFHISRGRSEGDRLQVVAHSRFDCNIAFWNNSYWLQAWKGNDREQIISD